jgi:hypothetical protein
MITSGWSLYWQSNVLLLYMVKGVLITEYLGNIVFAMINSGGKHVFLSCLLARNLTES